MSGCKGIPEALGSITVKCICKVRSNGARGKSHRDIGSLTVSSVNLRSLIQVFNLQNFLNKTYSKSLLPDVAMNDIKCVMVLELNF